MKKKNYLDNVVTQLERLEGLKDEYKMDESQVEDFNKSIAMFERQYKFITGEDYIPKTEGYRASEK